MVSESSQDELFSDLMSWETAWQPFWNLPPQSPRRMPSYPVVRCPTKDIYSTQSADANFGRWLYLF